MTPRDLINSQNLYVALMEAASYVLHEGTRARLGYEDSAGVKYISVPEDIADHPNLFYFHEAAGGNSFVGQATNTGSAPLPDKYLVYGMPIRVKQTGKNEWAIMGLDGIFAAEYIGGEALQVPDNPTRLETFLPGMLDQDGETPSLYFRVLGGPIAYDNVRYYWETVRSADEITSLEDTSPATITLPTGTNARMVLVQRAAATGALSYKVGDDFPFLNAPTFIAAWRLDANDSSIDIFPTVDDGNLQSGFIRLQSTTTALTRGENLWTLQDIYTLYSSAATSDEKVGVTSSDTTPDYLNNKLTVDAGLSKTTDNPADDEELNLALDIPGLSAETSADDADLIAIYDDSATAHRKMTRGNFLSGVGGGEAVVDVEGVAGENLSVRDIVYQKSDGEWYKVDIDASPPLIGPQRGMVEESGGITSAATGTIRVAGSLSGFTGLTAGDDVWADTTAGGYTQTKPTLTAGQARVLCRVGYALSTTVVVVEKSPVQFQERASLADDATQTVEHYTDESSRSREAKAFINDTDSGASLAVYADTNQDTDYELADREPASYGSDVCTGGTASASAVFSNLYASKAFDDNTADLSIWVAATTTTSWLKYDLGSGNSATAVRYTLQARVTNLTQMVGSWTFEGSNNDSDWDVLDTQSSHTWTTSQKKTFDIDNETAYRYFRLNITANSGDGTYTSVCEMEIIEAATWTNGDQYLAQGFQVSGADSSGSVKLWLKKVGTPTGNLTVKIYDDSGGDPNALVTNGTSDTVAASSLSTSYGWTTFTFSTPPSLSGSTQYHLRLETADSYNMANYVVWGGDSSSPAYASGELKGYAGSWSAKTADACFEVFSEDLTYESPCLVGRWGAASGPDVEARFDDGSGSDGDTKTTFKNIIGATSDLTLVVELP